jgi:hypothetical protein
MRSFLTDLRYGLRGLTRNPGFAAAAVATLALGIGATIAVLGVADAALLKPLPYPEPERLVRVGSLHPIKNAEGIGTSYMDYRDWHDRSRSFEALGGCSSLPPSSAARGRPRHRRLDLRGRAAGLASTGARSRHRADGPRGGGTHVAIPSDALWKTRFGADRAILGRSPRGGDPFGRRRRAGGRFFFDVGVAPARDNSSAARGAIDVVGARARRLARGGARRDGLIGRALARVSGGGDRLLDRRRAAPRRARRAPAGARVLSGPSRCSSHRMREHEPAAGARARGGASSRCGGSAQGAGVSRGSSRSP